MIEIRLLREEDIERVNALYNAVYKSNRTKEKFEWEFRNGPVGNAIYVIAKDSINNKIVGTQCAMPLYLLNSQGEKILSAKSEDTLVHPDYRGQNIFEKMYDLLFEECRKAGIKYIWGFTYAIKPFVKVGFQSPFHAEMGMMVFNIKKSYNYLVKLNPKNKLSDKCKIFVLTLAAKIKYEFVNLFTRNKKSEYKIKEMKREEMNSLLEKMLSEQKQFCLFQNKAFLNWRIYTNPYPIKHYQYFLINSEENVVSDIILSINEDGLAYIIQYVSDRNLSPKIAASFFEKIIKIISSQQSIFMVRHWGFGNNDIGLKEITLLESIGFLFINRGITFVWKDLFDGNKLDSHNFILSRMASQGTT